MINHLLKTGLGLSIFVNLLIAENLQVNILNGTDNAPGYADKVTLFDMSSGMAELASLEDVNGSATFEDVNSNPQSQFMIQATLNKVKYSSVFVPEIGVSTWNSSVTVYNTKSELYDVQVQVPFFVIYAFENEVYVQKRIQFENHSNPPVSFIDTPGIMDVHIPDDIVRMDNVTIKSGSMPLRTTVVPTETGHVLPDPIKPGTSQVDLAYYLKYESNHADITEKILYDIEHFHIYVTPISMNFSGPGVIREGTDEENGFAIYNIDQVSAGTNLEFHLAGQGKSETEHQHEEQSTSRIVIEHRLPLSTKVVAAGILIVLIIFALFISMNQQNADLKNESVKMLKNQKRSLLKKYNGLSDADALEKDQILDRLLAIYKTLERVK